MIEANTTVFKSDSGQSAMDSYRRAYVTWNDMLDILLFVRKNNLDPDALRFIPRKRVRRKATRYKGVTSEGGVWCAKVQLPGEPSAYPVALFFDEEQAAVAYDITALAVLEDADTNLPPQTYTELVPQNVRRLIRIGLGHQYREMNNAAKAIVLWLVERAPHVEALRALRV